MTTEHILLSKDRKELGKFMEKEQVEHVKRE
jgi:hypothetical protein